MWSEEYDSNSTWCAYYIGLSFYSLMATIMTDSAISNCTSLVPRPSFLLKSKGEKKTSLGTRLKLCMIQMKVTHTASVEMRLLVNSFLLSCLNTSLEF